MTVPGRLLVLFVLASALPLAATTAAAAQTRHVSRAAVARGLQLTPRQQTHIRQIIDRGQRNGTPTLATQGEVLRVLTPNQRARLPTYASPRRRTAPP